MKKFKLFVILSLMIGALFVFCACRTEKLSAPTNVSVNVEDQLTWSSVENAYNYLVEIESEDGKIEKLSPKHTTASLSGLEEGDYQIRIKAVSHDSDLQDSDWTDPLYFHKDYETGCVYTLINNNTEYAITKYGKAGATVNIQDEYRGKPVTEIADKAFKGYSKIENVYVGKNVKRIGDGAFQNCKNLKTVTLPDTLTSIGMSAFQSCALLETINIPKGVTEIEDYTFAYCRALNGITLHDDLTKIGAYAFSDCSALTSLTIPDSVETIAEAAFTGNTALKELTIGKKITAIEDETFYMCKALEQIHFSNEGNLSSIGKNAFRECKMLKSLTIPEGVEKIDDAAFYTSMEERDDGAGNVEKICVSSLESISIPSTATQVGADAFFGTKLYVDLLENNDYVCIDNWLLACSTTVKNKLTKFDSSVCPNGLVGIGGMVFQGAPELTTVELPSSVKYIGEWAFAYVSKLATVSMTNVVKIDDYAFCGNEALYDVTLGKELETIGIHAFYDCKGLNCNNLELPVTVTAIGTEAFKNTYSSSSSGEVLYSGNWVVGYTGSPSVIELKKDTIGIADYAFYKCTSLTIITVPASVKYIGQSAFFGCSSLDQVILDSGKSNLGKIEDYAFYGCASLYLIDLPRELTSIGQSAFYKCVQLSEIDISRANVTSIGDYAFYQCINLKQVDLGNSLTDLGKYAFYKCLSLEEITLPNTLTSVSERTFYKCETLETVTFGNQIEKIEEYAFTGCVALERIKFPTALESIEKYAFFGCEELSYITFNDNLQSIGDFAFCGNVKIRTLEFPASLKNIGKYAFKGCDQMRSILLRSDLENIGAHAFYGCKNATFYTNAATSGKGWDKYWNSSYKGVVFGCSFSEDETYVASVTIADTTLQGIETATFGSPQRNGFIFVGWALSENGEVVYTAEQIVDVPVGTTLYTVWSDS